MFVFLAGTFLVVSLTCTDGQLTNEMSIVSTSQHQLPFGQIVTFPTYIAHDESTGNEHLPLGTDQLYVIRRWGHLALRRCRTNMYRRNTI